LSLREIPVVDIECPQKYGSTRNPTPKVSLGVLASTVVFSISGIFRVFVIGRCGGLRIVMKIDVR